MSHLSSHHVSSRQLREVVLLEKPRHLVEDKEDLERLFPKCPANTSENFTKQTKKSKRKLNQNNNQESSNSQSTPVANILDLDFNSNNDEQVNQQNRRYHQQVSTLAESVLSPTTSCASTPARNGAEMMMSTTSSSASSTTSDEKSFKRHTAVPGNGARVVSKNLKSPEMEVGTSPTMQISSTSGHRENKIEIAGGREVYHQSRVRSSRQRQHAKQRHSGDFSNHYSKIDDNKRRSTGYLYESQLDQSDRGGHLIPSRTSVAPVAPTVIKETVFSSEIHSIEYREPVTTTTGSRNYIYETEIGNEVVFDDIGEYAVDKNASESCDVNVTYDLLQGDFPPPSVGGLSVKIQENDETDLLSNQVTTFHTAAESTSNPLSVPGLEALVSSLGAASMKSAEGQSLDSLCLGAEANSVTEPPATEKIDLVAASNARMIGGITIDEYDGSPRRYRPRGSHETASNTSSNSETSKASPGVAKIASRPVARGNLRMPGFPQRVLPQTESMSSVSSSPLSSKKESTKEVPEEELLKFEEIPAVPQVREAKVSKSVSINAESCPRKNDYDIRYEFSETRKVLEEFFHSDNQVDKAALDEDFTDLEYTLRRRSPVSNESGGNSKVGKRLAADEIQETTLTSPEGDLMSGVISNQELLSLCTSGLAATTPSGEEIVSVVQELATHELPNLSKVDESADLCVEPGESHVAQPPASGERLTNDFTLSPEMTDCDSADLESEMSINEGSYHSSGPRMHTSMPVLEDGLSSGHASDLDDDHIYSSSGSVMLKKQVQPSNSSNLLQGPPQGHKRPLATTNQVIQENGGTPGRNGPNGQVKKKDVAAHQQQNSSGKRILKDQSPKPKIAEREEGMSAVDPSSGVADTASVAAALKDIKMAIQATRVLQHQTRIPIQSSPTAHVRSVSQSSNSSNLMLGAKSSQAAGGMQDDPWVRQPINLRSTANLTPQSVPSQELTPQAPLTYKVAPTQVPPPLTSESSNLASTSMTTFSASGTSTTPSSVLQTKDDRLIDEDDQDLVEENDLDDDEEEDETESEVGEERVPTPKTSKDADDDLDTDQETDRLLGQQYNDDNGYYENKSEVAKKKGTKTKEAVTDPKVLIEGVLFRARYLGSTQLVCEGQPTKATRMMQAEEAVSRIKAPEGDSQPSTEVDLFISTEKIMVLNTDLKEIMMDHALRTISYIADIGDLLVIMARRRPSPSDDVQVIGSTPKMICHVFESEEAQFIAQSIGQAFQVAYVEFLKANGIEDSSFVKEMDYQEVLNSQEIFNNELALFSSKERQKEVVVPKAKGEILGVVIVESGWGSMLPTIVLANLSPVGPAARCGQLNIGDQIIAINGISLVGLPLSTCQHYIKSAKNKTVVKLTAVSCAPVVEVKIKRPDTKYQLGFSVQNGVICSLLRGGIAERGGVRVGHRIIEINGQSVVAVPHEKIVNLLATSIGEITMKTMPTSMFRLLTGQETPIYI